MRSDSRDATRSTKETATSESLTEELALLARLQRTGSALASKLDLEGLARELVEIALDASGADAGAVFYRPHAARPEMLCLASAGHGLEFPARIEEGSLVHGDAFAAGAGHLVVPLVRRSGAISGYVALAHAAPAHFDARLQRTVAAIAAQAAIALDNALVHDETRRISEERARALEEERVARVQLAHTARARETELHDLAHTLRGPLNAIVGWADVLLTTLPVDSPHRNGAEIIARNARAQAELISSLLEGQREPVTVVRPVQVPAVVARGSRELPRISLGGARVLVLDDDGDARDLVRRILVDARADVITAASADEALGLLRTVRPDVIVSDIGMALRDGYQFIRTVRAMAPGDGNATPALALTGFAQSEDRVRALLAGFQDHVTKPVEAHLLVAAVQRLLPEPARHTVHEPAEPVDAADPAERAR